MLPPLFLRDLSDFRREATKREWWPEVESNHRHGDFQSPALPTELSGQCEVDILAFFARFKMTAAKKGVIKAKEVTGVK
jgi:hypothetical protein